LSDTGRVAPESGVPIARAPFRCVWPPSRLMLVHGESWKHAIGTDV